MWLLVPAAWAASIDVVVATHDLPAGATVGGADVRVVRGVPATVAVEGTIRTSTAAIGRVLVRRVLAGEVMREERFDPAYGTQVDARVAPGRHAVLLPLTGTVGDAPAIGAGGCVVSRDAPVALWQTADGAVTASRPEAPTGAWVAVPPVSLGLWTATDLALVDASVADCAKGTP